MVGVTWGHMVGKYAFRIPQISPHGLVAHFVVVVEWHFIN